MQIGKNRETLQKILLVMLRNPVGYREDAAG